MIKEFMVCIEDPKPDLKQGVVAVHPVVRVFNGNPEKYTSPEEVMNNFIEDKIYEGLKYLYVEKGEVNESEWNWLQYELRQPSILKTSFEVDKKFSNRSNPENS